MTRNVSICVLLLACLLAARLASAQVMAQRVRVSPQVAAKLLKKRVPAEYPQDAKDKQIEGSVILKVIVDKQGNVSDAELLSGEPALAPAAIEAVKQWKYRPFVLNGDPVTMETQVTVNFSLKK